MFTTIFGLPRNHQETRKDTATLVNNWVCLVKWAVLRGHAILEIKLWAL